MIVPSIDLQGGQAVQLVGGETHALDAGDPRPLARQFAVAGEVAVVDLDAARGRGDNVALTRELLALAPCRVGGGIRDERTAIAWLDAGAAKIVLGTAATPDLLAKLPRSRVIAALDARDGEVVDHGWLRRTGDTILTRLQRLRGLVGGYLITFVEREGRMAGTRMDLAQELIAAAAPARITFAGGITTTEEIAALDAMGADAQVGMALYTGRLELAAAIAAPLRAPIDGCWPTVVVDEHGVALGLVWSDAESLAAAVRTRTGVYHSRRRGLWVKGATSGAGQDLLAIDLDCDRDALRFVVRQHGAGFCHREVRTCWGPARGLPALAATIANAAAQPAPGSYTARLLDDRNLLAAKLGEEAGELAAADTRTAATQEAADLLYFTLVAMQRAGANLADVAAELDRRALRVTRRPGDRKPARGPT